LPFLKSTACLWFQSNKITTPLPFLLNSFELSREVVAVSISLFDRYLAVRKNKCSGNLALLTSLTTLHIAIKLHACKKIKLNTLANLSRGQFGAKHIEEMEWLILAALGWKLHPPTQYAFISHLLLLLPQEVNPAVRKELFELSRYQVELSICDSFFVDVNSSTVAFSAILNVLDDISYSRLSAGLREKFLLCLSENVGLHHYSRGVVVARDRLRNMFASSSGRYGARDAFARLQDASNDANSLTAGSVSSSGSACSSIRTRARTNSVDSKGNCRYSPSPRRRFVASVSHMSSSRANLSTSPMVP
jgi:hypothetical protein